MSKIGKSFTIDIKAYQWLKQYAAAAGKKESYIVNEALLKIKREMETWNCPECGQNLSNDYKECWKCVPGSESDVLDKLYGKPKKGGK